MVMAYTDYPAAWMSRDVLVNDVDLTVTDVDGKKVAYPNECAMGGRVSRRRNSADRENNVEVVKLTGAQLQQLCGETREVVVSVKKHSLSSKFQPVSIVIRGDFDFDGVTVEDDKTKDESDVPGTLPADMTDFWNSVLLVIAALVLIAGW